MKSARVVLTGRPNSLSTSAKPEMPVLCDCNELRADLAARAGLGLDHDRLFQNRLHRAGDRPRDDVVGAARWKRVDDRDRMRGKLLLRKSGTGGECCGRAEDETAAIHDPLLNDSKSDDRIARRHDAA